MRFTQAYAGATVCAPSRCSLMTGKHNGHAFIRGNREVKPEGQTPMPAETFTVAHLMKQAGYHTGCIGKWGLGKPDSASTPDKMGCGFDQAARMGDWKAVRRGLGTPLELYDLKTDLGEQHDVSKQHADVVQRFEAYLRTARVDSELWPIRAAAGKNKRERK